MIFIAKKCWRDFFTKVFLFKNMRMDHCALDRSIYDKKCRDFFRKFRRLALVVN